MNETIFPIVEDYISKPDTDYCLLITGPWGCGKSYYWKNSLAPKIEELSTNSESGSDIKQYRTIYISLNGVNSAEQIMTQILSANYNVGSGGKLAFDVASALTDITKESRITSKIIKSLIKEVTSNKLESLIHPANTVICFDDLERCGMDIQEIFGYITTTFVERQHYKIIFIADETELIKLSEFKSGDEKKSKSHRYDAIKEKIIGRTLRFRIDLKGIVTDLCNSLGERYDKLPALVSENTELIMMILNDEMDIKPKLDSGLGNSAIKKDRIDNIRTIRFALEMLAEINQQSSVAPLFQRNCREMILFVLMFAIEHKEGGLSSEKYLDPGHLKDIESTIFMEDLTNSSTKDGDNTHNTSNYQYKRKLKKRYFGSISIKQIFVQGIYEFILTGYWDESQIDAQVKEMMGESLTPLAGAYRALQSSTPMEDSDFENSVQLILAAIEKRELNVYEWVDIYKILVYYITQGLIRKSEEELRKSIIDAINDTIISSVYDDDWARKNKLFDTAIGNSNANLQEVIDVTADADKELRKLDSNQNIEEYLQTILSGQVENNELVNQIVHLPILELIDEQQLLEHLRSWKNTAIDKFTEFLKKTLPYNNSNFYLYDPSLLEKYIVAMKKEMDGLDEYSMRRFYCSQLKDTLSEIKKNNDIHLEENP